MEIVFLLVGLVFVAVGAAIAVSEIRVRAGATELPAELVGFSLGTNASGGSSFHAVARYQGLDGQARLLESTVGSSSPLGCVGDRLDVLVHPDDPENAAIKSPLTFVIGAVLFAMGLSSCIVFFAVFRLTPFSLASAAAIVGWCAWKGRGVLRGMPSSLEAWKASRSKLIPTRVFTEATKSGIRWAEPAAVEAAFRSYQKTNRYAPAFLIVAGVALLLLGGHLYRKTETFLSAALHATGTVVALEANHSSDGTTWAPLVEFEAGGRTHRFKDSVSSSPPSWRRGDRAEVLYDPLHPGDARIDRGPWNKGIPLLVAAAGVLFLALGLRLAVRPARDPLGASSGWQLSP